MDVELSLPQTTNLQQSKETKRIFQAPQMVKWQKLATSMENDIWLEIQTCHQDILNVLQPSRRQVIVQTDKAMEIVFGPASRKVTRDETWP